MKNNSYQTIGAFYIAFSDVAGDHARSRCLQKFNNSLGGTNFEQTDSIEERLKFYTFKACVEYARSF